MTYPHGLSGRWRKRRIVATTAPMRGRFAPSRDPHSAASPAPAFTLVEILCAVAVITLLLAITLPLLARSKAVSIAVACQANLRSCTQSVLLYAQDFRSAFPYLASRPHAQQAFENGGIWLPYYSQSAHWPLAMRGYQGVGESQLHPAQLCPGSPVARDIRSGGHGAFVSQYPPETVLPSAYCMTYGAFSDPSLWRPGADPYSPSGFRAVRTDEVLFPGVKIIVSEPIAYHLGPLDLPVNESPISLYGSGGRATRFHVAFADGSVRSVLYTDFLTLPPENALRTPTLATPDGIRGRDIR